MVFIGIVTSSMVKNTMSQSTAAAGYGSVRTVQSTAESGLIVTESYLRKPENAKRVSKMIDSAIDNNIINPRDTSLVRGSGGAASKTPFANGLMFSSRIVEITGRSNKDVIAGIDVRIGKSANGRDLGRYITYGTFGKYTQDDPEGNALYVGGSTNVISNVNITIPKGNATFLNTFISQRHFTASDGDLWVGGDTLRGVDGTVSGASFSASKGVTTKTEPPCCRLPRIMDMSVLPTTVVNVTFENNVIKFPSGTAAGTIRYGFNENIDSARLHAMFTHASTNSRLFNGFLVVEVNTTSTHDNHMQLAFNSRGFYQNVIFIVHGKFQPNHFYNNFNADTTKIGNTMIYLAPATGTRAAGSLSNFALPQRFNGMIYVHPTNADSQRIAVGSTAMRGTMLMTGTGPFELNTGGDGNGLSITYNSQILGSYGIPLSNPCSDDCGEAFAKKTFKFSPNDTAIYYKPFAHYFY